MELKTIIAIALVAFIIGGFIFYRYETERRNNGWRADEIFRPLSVLEGQNENAEND